MLDVVNDVVNGIHSKLNSLVVNTCLFALFFQCRDAFVSIAP